MKFSLTFASLVLLSSIIINTGCVRREPVGPAEQIGKGIDQMSKGIRQLDLDRVESERVAKEEREKAAKKSGVGSYDAASGDVDIDQGPTVDRWESYEEWQKRKGYR